jgi:hypothetical protein
MFERLLATLLITASVIGSSYSYTTCTDYTTYKGPLDWQPCKQKGYEQVECAEFDVPINWNDCSSDSITLTAARVPTNSPNKTGSLFLRYGGPGIVSCPTNTYVQQLIGAPVHINPTATAREIGQARGEFRSDGTG